MTDVVKYNTFKGISTGLTFVTPVATAACLGEMFISQPSTAISGAAALALLFAALFAKDKIAEHFKAPSALIVAIVLLIFCVIVEKIILPVKIICLTTIAACGVDEVLFKRLYKRIEANMPDGADTYKHFGFYAVKQTKVNQLKENKQ